MPEATLREQGVEKWNWRKALRAYKKDAVFRRKGIVRRGVDMLYVPNLKNYKIVI
jgi:hypothetical protein